MTTPSLPRRLPFTIAGRSPFDPIRLRWGDLGCVVLGTMILFTGQVTGIIFGILFILLGIATWLVTAFGETDWYDVDPPGRYVAGTGAVVGFIFISFFLLTWLAICRIIQLIAHNW
jgi:hypothetical protein